MNKKFTFFTTSALLCISFGCNTPSSIPPEPQINAADELGKRIYTVYANKYLSAKSKIYQIVSLSISRERRISPVTHVLLSDFPPWHHYLEPIVDQDGVRQFFDGNYDTQFLNEWRARGCNNRLRSLLQQLRYMRGPDFTNRTIVSQRDRPIIMNKVNELLNEIQY